MAWERREKQEVIRWLRLTPREDRRVQDKAEEIGWSVAATLRELVVQGLREMADRDSSA
jgi:hypothetical protein